MKVYVFKRPTKNPPWYLKWQDPLTGKWIERSARVQRKREAVEKAKELEEAHSDGYRKDVSWEDFRLDYELGYMDQLSPGSQAGWKTAANHIERLIRPATLQCITVNSLRNMASRLRKEGSSEASIATHLARIRAALGWAMEGGLITKLPKFPMPSLKETLPRGRALNELEFNTYLEAIPRVRRQDPNNWTRFARGLWESGFRISELLALSWSPKSEWSIHLESEIPMVRIRKQKNGKQQLQPITPAFWSLLQDGPPSGFCFPLPGKDEGQQMRPKTVCRVLSKVGRTAGIETDPHNGKYASAHDLRRSFCVRISDDLEFVDVSKWMRHASTKTTLKYYHVTEAEKLAKKVW